MTNFMRKIMAAVTGALLLATPALAWDQKTMNAQVDATNVLVNKSCSGTFLDGGYVLTAAHCIVDQYKTVEKDVIEDGKVKKEKYQVAAPGTVTQLSYNGPSITEMHSRIYKIVKSDRSLDLALLKVPGPLPSTAKIADTEPERGDPVTAVGNPYGVLYSSVTKGIVSSLNRSYRDLQLNGDLGDPTDIGEHGLVQHSASIAGGSSGGALYNDSGELIGVNVRGAPGFAFAVPLSDIKEFLKDAK